MAIYRNTISKVNTAFAEDVKDGLKRKHKTLPSKYFYDERGSELFSEIMQLPEYYLTDVEMEIFTEKSASLIKQLHLDKHTHFDLIELGAGDGKKTIKLIKALKQQQFSFTFNPIDISAKALQQLETTMYNELPSLLLNLRKGDYFNILNELKNAQKPKVVLFLGSNMGNMNDEAASHFLAQLSSNLNSGDKLVLGLDLQKSPEIILPAYNDSKGVTRDFNLNLLHRINKELDANFDVSQFEHAPVYDEENGLAISYIQSNARQEVTINALETTIRFSKGEKIHTEISRKYNDKIIAALCANAGFDLVEKICDSRAFFADYILNKR